VGNQAPLNKKFRSKTSYSRMRGYPTRPFSYNTAVLRGQASLEESSSKFLWISYSLLSSAARTTHVYRLCSQVVKIRKVSDSSAGRTPSGMAYQQEARPG